jgi:cytochrome c oxidase subunit 4
MKAEQSNALRRGVIVLIVLAALTGIEYVVAVSGVPTIFLWILAILKAAIVLQFFMHVGRVFGSEEEHE